MNIYNTVNIEIQNMNLRENRVHEKDWREKMEEESVILFN